MSTYPAYLNQFARKSWVDEHLDGLAADFVKRSGDTMTGALGFDDATGDGTVEVLQAPSGNGLYRALDGDGTSRANVNVRQDGAVHIQARDASGEVTAGVLVGDGSEVSIVGDLRANGQLDIGAPITFIGGGGWTGNRVRFPMANGSDVDVRTSGQRFEVWPSGSGFAATVIALGRDSTTVEVPGALGVDGNVTAARLLTEALTTWDGASNTRMRVEAAGGIASRFDFHLSDDTSPPLLRLYSNGAETMRMSALSNYGEIRNINASTTTRHRMYDSGNHFFDGSNFVFNDTGSFSGSLTAPRFIASNTGTSGNAAFQFGNNSGTGLYRNGNSITMVHQSRDVVQYGGTTDDHFFRVHNNVDRLYLGLRAGANPALNDSSICVARSDIGGGNDISIALYGLASYTTTAGANMHITGAYNVVRSTSSGRYKKDIENVERRNAYSLLKLARPVWYRSTASGDGDRWSHYGLIAEEIAEVDPRLVHWEFTGDNEKLVEEYDELVENADPSELRPGGVQYDRIAVMLLQVVEDHEDTIVEMERKFDDLSREVDELKARLATLESA